MKTAIYKKGEKVKNFFCRVIALSVAMHDLHDARYLVKETNIGKKVNYFSFDEEVAIVIFYSKRECPRNFTLVYAFHPLSCLIGLYA